MTDLRRVDLNLIVVLDAVLTERNLTRAGETLGMTQPAVSGALARLRQQFDDPLLVRQGRVFELTPLAERLLPAVQRAMIEIHRTLDVLPTFDPASTTRTFYLSTSDYVLSELTGPLQAIVRERAPRARVEFDPLPLNEPVSPVDLLRQDVVIAGTGRGVPGKHRPLFLDRFVCVASADHPRLVDGRLDLDAVAQSRHVHSDFGARSLTHVDEMLESAGITPRIAVTVHGFLQVPFMVAGSDLIGFVPERIALRHGKALGLVIAETPVEPMTLVEAAHWHPSRSHDPALTWLVDMLLLASEVVEFGAVTS